MLRAMARRHLVKLFIKNGSSRHGSERETAGRASCGGRQSFPGSKIRAECHLNPTNTLDVAKVSKNWVNVNYPANPPPGAFYQPFNGLAARSPQARPCLEFGEEAYVRCGVQRVLADSASGRAFLQEHGPNLESAPTGVGRSIPAGPACHSHRPGARGAGRCAGGFSAHHPDHRSVHRLLRDAVLPMIRALGGPVWTTAEALRPCRLNLGTLVDGFRQRRPFHKLLLKKILEELTDSPEEIISRIGAKFVTPALE